MVYCIGLTGGIASGKSTVAELFAQAGVHVINADKISRELSAKNQTAYNKIIARYGTEILLEDGEINRAHLRTIIFSDTEERRWLEQLLHPLIREQIETQVNTCTKPYCIVEIPLFIDKSKYPYINRILLVNAPISTQISRVMQRDKCSKEQALAILAAQPHMQLRLSNANDVLVNDKGFNELKVMVNNLHQKYLIEARRSS